MFKSSKEKQKSSGSLLPFVALVALVGGIGASVLAHPKSKKVRDDLGSVADELIDSLERVLNKVEKRVQHPSESLGEVSHLFLSAYDEIKSLNNAAVDEPKGVAKVVQQVKHEVVQVEEGVIEEVHKATKQVANVEDDISEKIAWLQRKGRKLAKRQY